ncbi:hypothetical protein [Streptomyces sp. NRRL B-24085]|uniref:hypothetical protein n=1 Tax=Streptomyces sp. NRRL B-24085 TaxID=1709476 RepID=UPI00131DB28E|nr:hypothetical protein [Streptomyces sp. NRRL B-24085]
MSEFWLGSEERRESNEGEISGREAEDAIRIFTGNPVERIPIASTPFAYLPGFGRTVTFLKATLMGPSLMCSVWEVSLSVLLRMPHDNGANRCA